MSISYASLGSGSSGNSHFVGGREDALLLDCGFSGKKIEENMRKCGLKPEKLKGILISHEHLDHIKGAGVMSRRYNIPIYATGKTWEVIEKTVGKITDENRKIFNHEESFIVGDIRVKAFKIFHDAVEPSGFSFFKEDDDTPSLSIATDLGHICKSVEENIMGSKIVVLEANHDVEMLKMGSYPYHLKRRILSEVGHLSNVAAGEFAVELAKKGTKTILLGHLSRENNFPDLAYETVKGVLEERGIDTMNDIKLQVLVREEASKIFFP